MLRPDMSPKPVMVEMRRFDEFRKSLPFAKLPPRRTDCVIVVPERTDGWPCGFGAYLLAVQAGFSPVFAGTEHDLPESGMYIVCSAEDVESYTYTAQRRIFATAKAGASKIDYKKAGVNVNEGYKAVDKYKKQSEHARIPGQLTELGAFNGTGCDSGCYEQSFHHGARLSER